MNILRIGYLVAMFAAVSFIAAGTSYVQAADCPALSSGDLFKVTGHAAVYRINDAGERLYFPNSDVYATWYDSYNNIHEIDASCVGAYPVPAQAPFGVHYAPGARLVKLVISPDVYALEPGGMRVKIESEAVAAALYGPDWTTLVRDVSDLFWSNYKESNEVLTSATPHNGQYIRIKGSDDVYHIENGARVPVRGQLPNYKYTTVRDVDEDIFNRAGDPPTGETSPDSQPVIPVPAPAPIEQLDSISSTLQEGQRVTVSNNITLHVEDITISASGIVDITVRHLLNGEPLDLYPYSHSVSTVSDVIKPWNEAYGYRLTLASADAGAETAVVTLKPLTGYIETPENLYDACRDIGRSHMRCYQYSLFEPVGNEIIQETANFILIGDASYSQYIEDIGHYMEQYYGANVSFLGIRRPIQEKVPIRFIEGGSVFVDSDLGIKWLVSDVKKNGTYLGVVSQSDQEVIRHELTHTIVRTAPLSDILNEGLATYVGKQTFNVKELECQQNGYTLFGEPMAFGKLNLYSQIPFNEGGSALYQTGACFWEEFTDRKGDVAFRNVMKLLDSNRNLSEKTSVFDMIEEEFGLFDFNMAYYRDKYGFDYTGENDEYGLVGEFFIPFLGSAGSRWDENYNN